MALMTSMTCPKMSNRFPYCNNTTSMTFSTRFVVKFIYIYGKIECRLFIDSYRVPVAVLEGISNVFAICLKHDLHRNERAHHILWICQIDAQHRSKLPSGVSD